MPSYSRPNYVVAFEPKRKPTNQAPWDCLPWTNQYWCQSQGFLPNGQGLASGFTAEAIKSLSKAQLAHFSPEKIEDAKSYLLEVQKRHRENPNTVLVGIVRIPGFTAFKNAMRVLIDRRGGTHELVWTAMSDKHATPTAALRDLRIRMELEGEEIDWTQISVPKSSTYFAQIGAHLGRTVFGETAINAISKTLNEAYVLPLQSFFTRTWETKQDSVISAIEQRDELPQDYERAMTAAKEKPTATRLMAASNSLRKWKETAEILGEIDSKSFKQQEDLLATLWQSLGRMRGQSGTIIKIKASLQALCSQEELDAAYHHYLEIHFPQTNTLLELPNEFTQENQLTEPLVSEWGTDLGVKDMLGIRIPDLVKLAGLPQGSTQFPFGEPGSKQGTSELEELHKATITPEWHQWVGSCCLFKAWFTSELGQNPLPSMICDGVGLGKTMQLVGSICLLVHHMEHQSRGFKAPPLLSKVGKQYFAGLPEVPRLPHLIIVPPSLSIQWREEILRYTKHGSFQVIIYSRSRTPRESFFTPGGIWDQAVTQSEVAHRTIVIAESTTIAKEFEECCERHGRDKTSIRQAHPQSLLTDCGPTIFDKQFAVGIVDEIHNFRNVNSSWEGVLKVLDRCLVRIGATATPIYTSHNDVLSALKLLRYQPLIGDQGVVQGDVIDSMEKEAAKKWKDPSAVQTFATILAKKRLEEDGKVPSKKDITEMASLIIEQENKNLRSFFIAYPPIQYVKKLLSSVIIRRDSRSLDPDGAKVVALQPYIESVVSLVLRPDEMESVAKIASRRPSAVTGDTGHLAWVNFFIDYRFVTFDKRMLDRHNLPHIWNQWTREDYEREASTKLQCLMKILQHHIQDKDAPPLFYDQEDGTPLPPAPLNIPVATRARKFVIFSMYQLPRLMIGKALELHGIQYKEYDGTMQPPARNAALKEFEQNESILVLLMSNVGNVGLNITRASILILVDQPWSYSELMQILGRLWRKGQLDIVLFYRLIALGTADTTMSCIATGKALMLEQLTSHENILDCIHGRDLATLDQADDEEEPQAFRKGKRSKKVSHVKPRPLKKSRRVLSDSDSEPTPSPAEVTRSIVPKESKSLALAQARHKGRGAVSGALDTSTSITQATGIEEIATYAPAPVLPNAQLSSSVSSQAPRLESASQSSSLQIPPGLSSSFQPSARNAHMEDPSPIGSQVEQEQLDRLKGLLKSVDLSTLKKDPQFLFHLNNLGLSLPESPTILSPLPEPVATHTTLVAAEEPKQPLGFSDANHPRGTSNVIEPQEYLAEDPSSSPPSFSPAEEFLALSSSPPHLEVSNASELVMSDDELPLCISSSGSLAADLSPPPSPSPSFPSTSKVVARGVRPQQNLPLLSQPQSTPDKAPVRRGVGVRDFPMKGWAKTSKRKADHELDDLEGGESSTSGTRSAAPILDEDLSFPRNINQLAVLKKKRFGRY